MHFLAEISLNRAQYTKSETTFLFKNEILNCCSIVLYCTYHARSLQCSCSSDDNILTAIVLYIRCNNHNIIIEDYHNLNSVVCVPILTTEGHCGSRSTDPFRQTHIILLYIIICRCPI